MGSQLCWWWQSGEALGGSLEVPLGVGPAQLAQLTNTLLDLAEPLPVAFFTGGAQITGSLGEVRHSSVRDESVIIGAIRVHSSGNVLIWANLDSVATREPFDEA